MQILHTVLTCALAAVLLLFAVPIKAEIFEGMPDVIVCELEIPQQERAGRRVFYIDAQEDRRVTRYTTLGAAPLQIRIGADGTVSQNSLGDCGGKTVAELKNADRAFDFED